MRLDSLLTSILPTPLTVSALLLCLASALVLGILTALVGAPFFVALLKKTKGGGWRV